MGLFIALPKSVKTELLTVLPAETPSPVSKPAIGSCPGAEKHVKAMRPEAAPAMI
jgi:hypothetical protein